MNRSFGGSLDCNSMNYNKGKSFRFSEWNSSTLYSNDDYIQDFVSYMGSMYACIQTNTAIEPTNTLYWKLVVSGQPGVQGKQGNTGVTFMPHVDEQGNLSWTNDGGLENPKTINIKGPKGEASTVPGPKGEKGDNGVGLIGPQGKPGLQGIGLDFNWDGTKLGIKRTTDEEYTYVDLKGDTGSRGTRGLQGIQGPEGKIGPKGDSLYIQVSDPNEFGQRFLQKRYNENEAWVSFFDLSQMKGPKGDSIIIESNLDTGNIEYRYQNQPSSANKVLIYKDDIKGPKGDTIAKSYVADDGYLYIQLSGEDIPRRVGYVKGDRGNDGREIVLRVYSGPSEDPNDPRIGTHLQWKYAGDEYKLWTNLIQINDLMNIALAGLKLEYNIISETDETGITTKYEVIELNHYQVEFDENNDLVLTEKIANLSSVKVPTKTLLKDIKYDYDDNKLIFVFDTATGEETIEIDCGSFIRQGNGITISDGNVINVNVASDSDTLFDDSHILTADDQGLRVRGLKDKLIKEINLIRENHEDDTHIYTYQYVAQDGTVYAFEIPDFVEWVSKEDGTKDILFRNNDKLVGWDTAKIVRNLIHIDTNNNVQVGDENATINLQGNKVRPYYNNEEISLLNDLLTEIEGLHFEKEDVPDEGDIAARYSLVDKNNNILGNVTIDILKDQFLKSVSYNEQTYTFTFEFWVNDDPEEASQVQTVTIDLQELVNELKTQITELDTRLTQAIDDLKVKHTTDINNINASLTKMYPKVFPLSVSVKGGGLYKLGTSQNPTITWITKESTDIITPKTVSINDEPIDPSITSKSYSNISSDVTYTVKVSNDYETVSGSTSLRFVNPNYFGIVDDSSEVTSDIILTFPELIRGSKSYTGTTTLNNQRTVYAYPKQFGALTSIKDANNFDYINSYTRSELEINGETYYVYVLTSPTSITTFKQIYA